MSPQTYSAERVIAARRLLLEGGLGAGGPAPRSLGIPELIERSWRRTISQSAGTDFSAPPAPRPAAKAAERLIRASEGVLDRWNESLADMQVALFVSDRSGRIIARRVSERSHARQLDRAHAAEGFDFSEAALGTNGLGTAMEERAALFVRGAEHVNESLQSLACAGAPICDPVSGRVVGSISLAAPLDNSDLSMLAIARQAARQVEGSIAEAATSGGLGALLAEFVGTSPRVPVIALSRSGLMSTTGALPLLSASTHVVLWDELQGNDWNGQHRSVSVSGRTGIARRLVGADGESLYIVELEQTIEAAAEASSCPGTTAALCRVLDAASAGSHAVSISGPAASGKAHLATAWLTGRDGVAPRTLPAIEVRRPSVRSRLVRELADGASIVLRNVEQLTADDRAWLRSVIDAADTRPDGILAMTLTTGSADAAVQSLVTGHGREVCIPSLVDAPERIVAITEEIAAQHRLTVPPAVLQTLVRWQWTGEVAELVHELRRAAALSLHGALELSALTPDMRAQTRQLYGIAASEYKAIDAALRAAGGNRSLAAESLGIGRTTLYRKMRQYGLDGTTDLSA